jgi:hypothetical protein
MPRLLAGAPGLGTSQDHLWLAVAGAGRLSLIDARKREEVAAAHLHAGDTDVGFVMSVAGPRLIALAHKDAVTDVRSYVIPTLEEAGQMELVGTVRIGGIAGDRVLVMTESGEGARVITVAPKQLAADAVAMREPLQAVATAPDDKVLVLSRDQIEMWDLRARRADAKLNLPVGKARQAGFSARRKLLWFSLGAPAGRLEVFRFSDGRLQLRSDFGKRVVAIDGAADSPRLVAAVRDGEHPVELVELDLSLHDRKSLGEDPTVASFCVLEGDQPALVCVDAEAKLRWRDLAVPPAVANAPMAVDRPRVRSATPAVVVRTEGGAKRQDPPTGSWRQRLGLGDAPGTPAPGAPTAAAPARAAEPAPAPDAHPAGTAFADAWRSALHRWGTQAITKPESASAMPEAPPIAALCERLELDDDAHRVLGLLYAGWLDGDGARGVAASRVARVLGTRSGNEPLDAHWLEALGRGPLGEHRLVESRRGRLRLTLRAGRMFDGVAPEGALRDLWLGPPSTEET